MHCRGSKKPSIILFNIKVLSSDFIFILLISYTYVNAQNSAVIQSQAMTYVSALLNMYVLEQTLKLDPL